MSWRRLRRPRRISGYEAQILRRVIEVGGGDSVSQTLLASIDELIVREEGDGEFHNDSLDFDAWDGHKFTLGSIVASAVGRMTNDAPIELILWARGDIVTYLELEPFEGSWRVNLNKRHKSPTESGVPPALGGSSPSNRAARVWPIAPV